MSTRPAPATPSPLAATLEARESALTEMVRGRLMQRSLQTLLDRVEGSRGALRHLAALETALIEHGAGAVPSISARGLTKILAQSAQVARAPGAPSKCAGFSTSPLARRASSSVVQRLAWVQMFRRSQSNTGRKSPRRCARRGRASARRMAANHCAAYIAPSE
jgi:hypothetical protein